MCFPLVFFFLVWMLYYVYPTWFPWACQAQTFTPTNTWFWVKRCFRWVSMLIISYLFGSMQTWTKPMVRSPNVIKVTLPSVQYSPYFVSSISFIYVKMSFFKFSLIQVFSISLINFNFKQYTFVLYIYDFNLTFFSKIFS